jgi:ubiquinone/menaquinone biosynthesis C-methylase UbiE
VDRAQWLAERRSAVEEQYSAEGPTYDDGYDPATPTHRRFVSRIVDLVPEGGSVLDAACGTAPYAGTILDAGKRYVGVDQSTGMLQQAIAKWPAARFEHGGLQELAFEDGFDAVICTDAMENVPPEGWPVVLSAFARALHPNGHLYITVEEIDRAEIEAASDASTSEGLPAVFGEVIEGDTAGYHFYPERPEVERWTAEAGFRPVAQEEEWLDGYGYHHLLLQRGDAGPTVTTSSRPVR